jgi:hypothetical protein
VILSVRPEPAINPTGRRGGLVIWEVEVLDRDNRTLNIAASGIADDLSAGRAAVELAYRATDGATRAGTSVVDSHMTETETETTTHRATERTDQEVQR